MGPYLLRFHQGRHPLHPDGAFCSYGGEALDKKTPLLRSMEALSKQALRLLKLFGSQGKACHAPPSAPSRNTSLDRPRAVRCKRKDLIFTGRTLFGSKPPKGQEMDDHYFGAIKPRVAAFMKELDEGAVEARHSRQDQAQRGRPAQHELAPIFSTANIATDHNQLTMEMMKKVAAARSGLPAA